MSKKFDAFMIALEALCREHDVRICVGDAGEFIVDERDAFQPGIGISADCIVDGTAGNA